MSEVEKMKTKVVHCKKEPYDVIIDRTTIFGNPFMIGKHGNREEVIRKYKQHFDFIITIPKFKKALLKLKGKTLGCWCKPKACHGDIIIEYLEKNNE
jgi:hypothetical protein